MKKLLGALCAVIICFFGIGLSACTPNYDNVTLSVSTDRIEMAVGEVHKFNFEISSAPDGMVPTVKLNNTQNLFRIEKETVEGNKVFYEIKALKSGKTTVNALSFEGNKTVSFEVEVFDRVTSFSAKNGLCIVAEDGNKYTLKNQSYFNFLPVNSKIPEIKYTYGDQEVSAIIVKKDEQTGVNRVKLLAPNGAVLQDAYGQEISFAQGEIILEAEALDYTSALPMTDVGVQEVKLQIVPQIESGALKLLRKGGLSADATKYYGANAEFVVTSDTVLTVIKNRISDSFFVFEVECDTPNVVLSIQSTIFECTPLDSTDEELLDYVSTRPCSKFFSLQAKGLGEEVITVTLKYEAGVFGQVNYEKTYSFTAVSLMAPYQIAANSVVTFNEPITLYDNAKSPYKMYVNVLDKTSTFKSVRVSLATLDGEGKWVENPDYYDNIALTYGSAVARKEAFEIPFGAFSAGTSVLPVNVSALESLDQTIYVVLKVIPLEISGVKLDLDVETGVPFVIHEGIDSFGLKKEYLQEIGLQTLPRTLYLDLNDGKKTFDGFEISNIETANLGQFKFEFDAGAKNVVGIKQVVDPQGKLTAQLEFEPLALGTARVKVEAQEGYFVNLTIEVVQKLSGATLGVNKIGQISSVETTEGSVSSLEVAFEGKPVLDFVLQKAEANASLYKVLTEVDNTSILDVSKSTLLGASVKILSATPKDTSVRFTLHVQMQQVGTLFNIEPAPEEENLVFDVEIIIYSPISNIEFITTIDEKPQSVHGLSVFRQSDVGFKYDTLSSAECVLKVTLKNGEEVEEPIGYYLSQNAMTITTSYGALDDRDGSFFINQFGDFTISNDGKMTFKCNYEAALTGTFVLMVTIEDHSSIYHAPLNINVKTFRALEYVGISNYQEQLYLSGARDSHTFFTYMDPLADIQKFEVVFVPSAPQYASLVSVSVNSDCSEVVVKHNGKVSSGSGTLYFVPRTLFGEDDSFPQDKVQKIEVVYSDGSNRALPELISTAGEFMAAFSSAQGASKHYVITNTIDLAGKTFENIKPLQGSISGANPNARIVNVDLVITDQNAWSTQGNIGLFPQILSGAEVFDLTIEGSLSVKIDNLGISRSYNIGLLAGQNYGNISNVSVVIKNASVLLGDKEASNKVALGAVVGQNHGQILSVQDTSAGKDPILFGQDLSKNNLTTLLTQASFVAVYNGESEETFFGGIAGKNLGKIQRGELNFTVYNANTFSQNVTLQTQGFTNVGGVVGVNGSVTNAEALIENLTVTGSVSSTPNGTLGGKNVGGVAGKNFAEINKVISLSTVKGEDFVGGLIGFDSAPNLVKTSKVIAVRQVEHKPMISAISATGNVGAFSGNESTSTAPNLNQTYLNAQNEAKVYYTLNLASLKSPIVYHFFNGAFQKAKQSAFVESQDAIKLVGTINGNGAVGFDSVSGIDKSLIMNMFIYEASSSNQQSLISHLNSSRSLPFVFENSGFITITSLNPEILGVNAFGEITLIKEGVATLQITSVLDPSVLTKVYINVTKAFDRMEIQTLEGEKIASNAYINVYSYAPASIQFKFLYSDIVAIGSMGEQVKVKLTQALSPDIDIKYEEGLAFTRAEKYGNMIVLTTTGQNAGINNLNTVVFSPVFELKTLIDGKKVECSLTNFQNISLLEWETKTSVLARFGTQSISTDFEQLSLEPVDEILVTVTQVTDEQTDSLTLVQTKNGVEGNYFNVLSHTETETINPATSCFEKVHEFVLKYNYELFPEDYASDYVLTFASTTNKISKQITVTLLPQSLEKITLKNYYNPPNGFDPSLQENNQVSGGDYNLLEINVYPYFASYDRIRISNHPENYDKNNVLLMQAMVLKNGSLELLNSAEYSSDGILISQEEIEKQKLLGTDVSRIFVKYTTISLATEDTMARLIVTAENVNPEKTVLEETLELNVVIKDSVFFTIDSRAEADEYYLAKGLEYDLTLHTYGFSEQDARINVTHENLPTSAVQIKKENGKYKLVVSDEINYSVASENRQGFEVVVTTHGENVVDGIHYKSAYSNLKLVIVDFAVLTENLGSYYAGDNLDEFAKQTLVAGSEGALASVPVGSGFNLEAGFKVGQTIEFDQSNQQTLARVSAFEKSLSQRGTWAITATNPEDGVLGAGLNKLWLTNESSLSSGFLKIDGLKVTPLRVNDYNSTKYYMSYAGSFYYDLGIATFGITSTSFNLDTDFVLSAYPNSSQENAIPVSTYQEFLAMQEGGHYIQLSSITLPQDYQPYNATFASFDGNGHSIILPNSLSFEQSDYAGVFASLPQGSVLKNVTIQVPTQTNVVLNVQESTTIFGTLVGENNGIITNCKVIGQNAYSQLSVSIPNQNAEYANNYVCGLVGVNNGFITSSSVSVNLTAATNVAGFSGINNNKIASSFVKNSMIINKSAFSASHKTAGFVVQNGASGNSEAVIQTSYVCGADSEGSIYSLGTDKTLNSMPSSAGFVYTNYNLIQDSSSDILINTSSPCAGFVFENSGKIVRAITTSTFSDPGQEAYIFVSSNKVSSSGETGKYQDCFYLVGDVNKAASKQLLDGLTSLNDPDFANPNNFANFAISSNLNKTEGVWFYPAKDVESEFLNNGTSMKFTYGKPQLVAPNIITSSQRVLDENRTTVDDETGQTLYAYIETREAVGTKFNPILITSASSFEENILAGTVKGINSNHYRLVSDFDYQTNEVFTASTFETIFTGMIEGNGMEISGFAIDTRKSLTSAGLFAQIGSGTSGLGIVKNLILTPRYLNMPNASQVGTLAGRVESGRLFNITVNGFARGLQEGVKILGANAVGGVVGFATNGFKMQNIISSVSANATYSHEKAHKQFTLYKSKQDLQNVSYAGSVVGIAHANGSMRGIQAENQVFAIAEVAGLISGFIGSNVTLSASTQTLQAGQFVQAEVYAGIVAGALSGTIEEVVALGQTDADFFKKSITTSQPAEAIGGLVGVMTGGLITSSTNFASLTWQTVSPKIVGGVVGEMLGGTLWNTHFKGENITATASNNAYAVVEFTFGGLVGRIAPSVSIRQTVSPEASDVLIALSSASGDVSVNLVGIMRTYIGGIVGQVIQNYHEEDTYNSSTLPRTSISFNGASSSAEILVRNIIYGGVLTSYIGGIAGAVFADLTLLTQGEVEMQDIDQAATYQTTSSSKLSLVVEDNKSSAQVHNYYGGILGWGKTVESHTIVKGKFDAKNFPWGALLEASWEDGNFTSPEYLGKWADEDKTIPAEFKNTEYMNISVTSPIMGNLNVIDEENRL